IVKPFIASPPSPGRIVTHVPRRGQRGAWLESSWSDELRGGTLAAAWMGALRPPVRGVVRLLRRLSGGARRRGPGGRGGVLERHPRDRGRESPPRADRADRPELRPELGRPHLRDVVHVLALAVRRRRTDAPVRVLPAPRSIRRLPQLAHRRERHRPHRLRADAYGAPEDVPRVGLQRHARRLRVGEPRQWADRLRGEPVRGDAQPARDGRADRRCRDGLRLSLAARAGAVAGVAGVGVLRGDGHREPLLARLRGGVRHRAPHRAPALPQAPSTRARGHRVSEPGDGSGLESGANAVSQLARVKQEYTAAARELLRRSMQGVARTKLTPDMLSIAGLALCVAGAVLVGFEQRNEYLFFWLGGVLFVAGSIADILDGALARAAGKGTVFGAFLDSTFDRLGEAAMLTAIGLVFMRDGNEVALVATFLAVIGSMLVSYTRAKAEMLGLRGDVGFGSRLERVVIVSVGLGLAPWGWLQWPIYLLALMAWVTVVQRMLFVRRQLRELAEPA